MNAKLKERLIEIGYTEEEANIESNKEAWKALLEEQGIIGYDNWLKNLYEICFEENPTEKIAEYQIIAHETYNENGDTIILGAHPKNKCTPYATWEYNPKRGAYWGHYYETIRNARRDYHRRLEEAWNRPF